MKNITVLKKINEEYKYTLLRDFDNQDDLDLWLNNTTENKHELFIVQQYKRRNIKHYKCEECEQISTADDINDATIKYFGEGIEPITGDKYDGDYMCPKCNTLICGENFKEID